MAKNKISGKELRLLIGVVLILIGLFGISNLISVLLIIAGGYLILDGVRKKG